MAKFGNREQVRMSDASIMGALCTLGRSFAGRSHLTDTIVEVFTR